MTVEEHLMAVPRIDSFEEWLDETGQRIQTVCICGYPIETETLKIISKGLVGEYDQVSVGWNFIFDM